MNKKIYILILIVLFLIISIIHSLTKLEIDYYEVKNNKISKEFEGFKVLHLSDLHNGKIGKNNMKLLKQINNIAPDIIVMTGDMIDIKHTNYDVVYELIKQLNNAYPIYYVCGNHEISLSKNKLNEYIQNLKKLNVTVLKNEKVSIEKNGEKINIYGLDFTVKMYKDNIITLEDVTKMLGNVNTEEFNILLTHNPLMANVYSKWGADLVFSGHIHGGNVRIPGIGGVFSPDISLFPKYSKGMYDIEKTNLVVSAGLSAGTLKIRMFNPMQVPVVVLKNA